MSEANANEDVPAVESAGTSAAAAMTAAVATAPDAPSPADARAERREEDRLRDADAVSEDEGPEPRGARRFLPLALAFAAPALLLFVLPPLSRSGLWDPYELNVADLARRVALNLHGATDLALSGADNSLPHLNDLGRPQLPFTSIALGFKLFGLHEWAGRLPLALWGLAGVLATYGFIARLSDRRAGVYAAVALTTMPLYFVQARTMMGDIVAMSALAMAFGGLAVAVFDRDVDGPRVTPMRLAWLALGLLGLAAGYMTRGALLGVAIPTLAIGLAWFVTAAAGEKNIDVLGRVVALASLAAGIAAVVKVASVLGEEKQTDLNLLIGAMVKPQGKYPTFDLYIGHIGHALVPWSAFVPFAIGRLFVAPVGRTGALRERESFLRVALLTGAAVAFVAHGYLGARTDLIAFVGPALLAGVCGVAIRDFERGAHASIAMGVGTMAFLGVFHHDFHELPDKAYQAFAIVGATFPESFKDRALLMWWIALGLFAAVAFLSFVERDASREPFSPTQNLRILNALRGAWDGLLVLGYFAVVAGTSLAGLVVFAGLKLKLKFVATLSLQLREGTMKAWWVTSLVPLAVIFGLYFASDLWLWAFNRSQPLTMASLTRGFEPFEALFKRITTRGNAAERLVAGFILLPLMVLAVPGAVAGYLLTHGTRPVIGIAIAVPSGIALFLVLGFLGDLMRGRRAMAVASVGMLVGVGLSCFYYPALANQLSPKEVFETYQRVHRGAEPLGLFGVGGRTAAYYAGGQPPAFTDTASAYTWLTSGSGGGSGVAGGERRFLAVKAEELPRLNQLFRTSSSPRLNLPVIDARSSQILLVASSLEAGQKNQSPLEKIFLAETPKPQRPLDVNMEDKLQVLGYDLTDQAGKLIDVVAPGRKYRMRTYYRVLAPVGSEWEAFIHIDGYQRRHNGDHKPVGGKYPMSLWGAGDLLVDDYEFALEPNFTPGNYTIYFGLFVGETRLKVKSGPSDSTNRINGGTLRVQ